MADVLSQAQIDALINAQFKDESILVEKKDPEEEKEEYRKYDFRTPRRYSKERLKMLNSVFENYTRVLSTRITGLMHSTCEVNVDAMDEQPYYEFSNALTDGQVVTLAYLRLGEVIEGTPVVISCTPNIMLSMFDRLLGGTGEVEDDLPSDYSFTDMDFALFRYLMKDFVSVLGGSWSAYANLAFDFGRVELNPTLIQLVGMEETVVVASININFANCAGRMDICMPDSVLAAIFGAVSVQNTAVKKQLEDHSDLIYYHLQDTHMEITAELGRAVVLLRDVYNLNVGDVIDMNIKKDSAVALRIGGTQWFSGLMGSHEKHMAVKIQEVYHVAGKEEAENVPDAPEDAEIAEGGDGQEDEQ